MDARSCINRLLAELAELRHKYNVDSSNGYDSYVKSSNDPEYNYNADKIGYQIAEYMEYLNKGYTQAQIEIAKKVIKSRCEPKDTIKGDKRKDCQYVWLTVNPREQVDYAKFFSITKSFFQLKVVGAYQYCFEQRGTDMGDYKGMHLHALFKRNKPPSHVKKEIHRIFDSCVGEPTKHIRISMVDEDQLKKIDKYMSGDKADKDKLPKARNDKFFRQHYGLQDKYSGGGELLVSPRPQT